MGAIQPTFRTATKADLDRFIEIHVVSYPETTVLAHHERCFTANPLGTLDDLFVAEAPGTRDVVAFGYLYPLEAHFGNKAVRVGGIASIAVAPEVRGRGVGAALARHLHVMSDVRGDAITMLYAFREGYYDRLGYARTAPRKRLAIHPPSIPETWRDLRPIRRPKGDDRETICAAHVRAAARSTGMITRPQSLWDRLFARTTRQVLLAGDSDYVAFHLEQPEAGARTTLVVEELVGDDEVGRRALFGAIGAMRDQVSEIVVEVPLDDPIDQVLVDMDGDRFGTADVERPLGMVIGGPLVRIEDATRAIEARGWAASGSFDVVLGDVEEIAFSVKVEDGRAEVSAARGGGALRTTRKTLAAILFGGLRASDAARLGLADADPRTLSRVDAMAALPKPCPVDPF